MLMNYINIVEKQLQIHKIVRRFKIMNKNRFKNKVNHAVDFIHLY